MDARIAQDQERVRQALEQSGLTRIVAGKWQAEVGGGDDDDDDQQGERCPPVEFRGVSLGFLKVLADTLGLWEISTKDLVETVIKPWTNHRKCRFVELDFVKDYTGKPHVFCSHAWNGSFGDVLSSMLKGHQENHVVWLDVFAVLQHPQIGQKNDLLKLNVVIKTAGTSHGTFLVWNPNIDDDLANPLLRCWCLYEILITLEEQAPLVVKLGGQGKSTKVFQATTDDTIITSLLYQIDIAKANATYEADKQRIMGMVKDKDDINTRIRTAVFHNWRLLGIPGMFEAITGDIARLQPILEAYDPKTYTGDPQGTLLHDLVHGNFVEGAKHVLELAPQFVNATTAKGNTPLMFACEGDYVKMVALLLENGAKLDLQNHKGETALILAAKFGRVQAAKLLIQHGADNTIVDNGGHSALDWALANKMPGCKQVVALLDTNKCPIDYCRFM